ncbi:hypothetical protein [Wolbachia endosymbiont of Armadillidium vulgare]|uniref:hypothetical protein n=1 Tax=Wolbachia endosymbiont of Armadillidium vulgare TaxID=77039 RepID=UPI001292E02F|nr:hypothetical protein [Wolbachia endosymbiont of Armadillidium vulgare]
MPATPARIACLCRVNDFSSAASKHGSAGEGLSGTLGSYAIILKLWGRFTCKLRLSLFLLYN